MTLGNDNGTDIQSATQYAAPREEGRIISGLWLPNSYIINIHKGAFFAINFLKYLPPVMVYHARVGHSSQYDCGARIWLLSSWSHSRGQRCDQNLLILKWPLIDFLYM